MRYPSNSTFSDEEVQSGSATGFSDGEEMTKSSHKLNNAFDPVTQILDKIDAELVSLTRSQGSSSTATTGTDNTVIRRPESRQSLESSRLGNGDSLSISQLGANFKPSISVHSEQDTGIGTSSLPDSSLHHRSLEPDVRPLEPGDSYREDHLGHHKRSATAPEMYLNGHHMSDDDKQKRENQTGSPFEAKQVDDKFKEIMQKRKGGFMKNVDDDTQTIRTEDFVDKFQDTLVYSSDGGTRPLPRPKKKLASSLEIRPRKAAGPGTPPVYPKPTPTTSLPRPSTRSALKINQGHVSDADSVRTEDFEHKFKDMIVTQGNRKEESDLESVSNDPIHTKVKQLLKATAKYKPKPDYKTKPHVRISPKPVLYENNDKGDDSDDTLCSDKHATVSSYRSLGHLDPSRSGWNLYNNYSSQWVNEHHQRISNSPSLDDSLSKSSSFSYSSRSSSEREKRSSNEHQYTFKPDIPVLVSPFSRQVSQASNITSLASWSGSEIPNSSSASRCTSTGESMFDDIYVPVPDNPDHSRNNFKNYQYSDIVGPTRRRSSLSEVSAGPYSAKKTSEDNMKTNRDKRKHRDIIVQEEEEEYPFAKYTFNKKSEKRGDDSMSSTSSISGRSSSQESIFSVGLMKQYASLKNNKVTGINKRSSSSSIISSFASSFNDPSVTSVSMEDSYGSQDFESMSQDSRVRGSKVQYRKSTPNLFLNIPPPQIQNPYNYQAMYNFPQVPAPNPEQLLNSMGFNEAQSILPERFMKSWVQKALQTQHEEYARYTVSMPSQGPPVAPTNYYDNPYYVDDSDLPPSVSAQHSVATTPQYSNSLENIHGASLLFPKVPSRLPEKRRLQRSYTFNAGSQSFNRSNSNVFSGSYEEASDSANGLPEELSYIGALPLKKENSFDKLKRILHSSVPVHYKEKNFRRSAFAASHQKSLPLFLETLTEEEEERRRSRTPSFDRNSTKSNNASKMRSFLEEEERRSHQANSSEYSSDFSQHSSFSGTDGDNGYNSFRNTCVCGEFKDRCRCKSNCEDTVEDEKDKLTSKLSIPSIIVSEKETAVDHTPESNGKCHSNNSNARSRDEPVLPKIDEESIMSPNSKTFSRPASPNPETQEDASFHPGHNFEIAEIFSKGGDYVKERKIPGKRKSSKDLEPGSFEGLFPKSGQFLNISTFDLDEKHQHLTPCSSVASPNIMSPITVIEVHKLDNQNDSLELDEGKVLEQKSTRHMSFGTTDSRSLPGTVRHVKLNDKVESINQESFTQESVTQRSCHKRRKTKKHSAPKCLSLKRHYNDCDSLSGKGSDSESENVFIAEDVDLKLVEKKSIEVQAEDNSLCPIITFSDVMSLLQQLSQTLPDVIRSPLFVVAHDRAVQCDIESNKIQEYSVHNETVKKELVTHHSDNVVAQNALQLNTENVEHQHKECYLNLKTNFSDCSCQTDDTVFLIAETSKVPTICYNHYFDNIPIEDTPSELGTGNFCSVKKLVIESPSQFPTNVSTGWFKSEMNISLKKGDSLDRNNSNKTYRSEQVITTKNMQITLCDNIAVEKENTHDKTEEIAFTTYADNGTEKAKCIGEISEQSTPVKDTVNMNKVNTLLEICREADSFSNFISEVNESLNENNDHLVHNKYTLESLTVEDDNNTSENGNSCLTFGTDADFGNGDIVSLSAKFDALIEELNVNKELLETDYSENSESTNESIPDEKLYHSECSIYPSVSFEEITNVGNENCGKSTKLSEGNVEIIKQNGGDTEKAAHDFAENIVGGFENTYTSSNYIVLKSPHKDLIEEEVEKEDYIHNINISFKSGSTDFDDRNAKEIHQRQHWMSRENSFLKIGQFSCNNQQLENDNIDQGAGEKNDLKNEHLDDLVQAPRSLVSESYSADKANGLLDVLNKEDDDIIEITENSNNVTEIKYILNNGGKMKTLPEKTNSKKQLKEGKENLLRKFRDLIGYKIDDVENSISVKTESSVESESSDPKSQVMSARSLDFETIGSRKNILQRIAKTGFAKSFELSVCDAYIDRTKEAGPSKTLPEFLNQSENKLSDSPPNCETIEPSNNNSEDVNLQQLGDGVNKDSEFEIKDYYQSDDCEKVMYQVGLNYNKDKNCYDVFGRVKILPDDAIADASNERDSDHDSINASGIEVKNIVGDFEKDNVMKLITDEIENEAHGMPIEEIFAEIDRKVNKSQKYSKNENEKDDSNYMNGIKHDKERESHIPSKKAGKLKQRPMFDIFKQVVEDYDDEIAGEDKLNGGFDDTRKYFDSHGLHRDNDQIVANSFEDNNTDRIVDNDNNVVNIDDEQTRKTLEKIERLYSLSVYEHDNIPRQFRLDLGDTNGVWGNDNVNLDNEMKYLDSFDEYGFSEIHTCKNCGHSVSIETNGSYLPGEVVEHDFCCKCSPLKLPLEVLERRRLERLTNNESIFDP